MDFQSNTVNAVLDNVYTDDCLKSVGHQQEVSMLAKQLYQLLHRGGFRLTTFISDNNNKIYRRFQKKNEQK